MGLWTSLLLFIIHPEIRLSFAANVTQIASNTIYDMLKLSTAFIHGKRRIGLVHTTVIITRILVSLKVVLTFEVRTVVEGN